MGIKMPIKGTDEPLTVEIKDTSPGSDWDNLLPFSLDGIADMFDQGGGWWLGIIITPDFRDVEVSLYIADEDVLVELIPDYPPMVVWVAEGKLYESPLLPPDPALTFYAGGQAILPWGQAEANDVAALFGMPFDNETFYEPMPLATPGKSYRFASRPSGSRVYIRTV